MSTTPQFAAAYRTQETSLFNQHGTRPRPIFTAGANGSRVHAITCASDDSIAPVLTLFKGKVLSSSITGGQLTKTTNDTIGRSAGSFITEGWQANQRVFVYGSTTLANDVLQHISSVAASTLTFSGSPLNVTEAFPSSGQLVQASILGSVNVPAGSGNSGTIPTTNVLSSSQIPSLFGSPDNFIILGPNEMLFVALSLTPTALKSFDIIVDGSDY